MKKTGLAFLGIAAAFFLTKLIVRACSDFGYSDDANTLVYFHDNLSDPVTFSPFYYIADKKLYNNQENDSLLSQIPDANITEWVQYGGHSFTARDADSLIYQSDAAYMSALKDQTPLHDDPFAGNSMKAWLQQSAHTDALTYLLFSKRCEPYNQPALDEDKWVYNPLNKDSAMQLFQEGRALLNATHNPFLKEKYYFQLARLSNHNDAYDSSNAIIREMGPTIRSPWIANQIKGLQAGNFYHTGHYDQAANLYAQAFSSATDKTPYFFSYQWCFRPHNNDSAQMADISRVYDLAGNDQEKAAIAIMEGLSKPGIADSILYECYNLDPEKEGLGVLLSREIAKIEQNYWQPKILMQKIFPMGDYSFYTYGNYWFGNSDHDPLYSEEIKRLITFCQKVVHEHKTSNAAFYALAAAHLNLMAGSTNAETALWLQRANELSPSDKVKDMIAAENLLATVMKPGQIDDATEARILPSLKWMVEKSLHNARYMKSLQTFLTSFLNKKYYEQGDTVKGIICFTIGANLNIDGYDTQYPLGFTDDYEASRPQDAYYYNDLYPAYTPLLNSVSMASVLKIKEFALGNGGTAYHQWLRNLFPLKNRTLNNYIGTRFLASGRYAQAAPYLNQLSQKDNDPGIWDPFTLQLRDVPSFDSTVIRYSKHRFDVMMNGLSEKILAKTATDKEIFQYANALYAVSYYGGSGNALDPNRSYSDNNAYYQASPVPSIERITNNYYSTREAFKYYQLAYKNSRNPEIKAACLFGMAKCWQKWEVGQPDKYGYYFLNEEQYFARAVRNPYFKTLTTQFRTTKAFRNYYEDCSTLAYYIRRNRTATPGK